MEDILIDIRAKREFENALENATHLSEKSKKQYKTAYKKMKSVLPNPVIKTKPVLMVECLRELPVPPETKNQYITVMLMIYRTEYEDENYADPLIYYRGKKVRNDDGTYKLVGGDLSNDINTWKINKKMEIGSNLPTAEALKNHYETLYKQNNYRDFILNFLIVNLGIRNKDCNIIIDTDKRIISTKKQNMEIFKENYIYVLKSGYCWWVCNDYKTSSTYGRKRIRIRNQKFYNAIKKIYNYTVGGEYLLQYDNGKNVPEDGLCNYIKPRTYDGIGEGMIFKALVHDIMKRDISEAEKNQKLKIFSETRGTDISTIINTYATDIPI